MKRFSLKQTALVLTIPILISSCATIFGHSSYPMNIRTNPTGANIIITDKHHKAIYKGTSPATVTLQSGAGFFSKAQYQVTLSSPNYNEQIIPIIYKLNGWYFGNIFIGLLGFLIIDPATGAMWKLASPKINVTLTKFTPTVMGPTLKIIDIKDVPENMKANLEKLK